MGSSGSMRPQIGSLIIATSGVQLANGFFNTLISLRVAIESFEATMAGLVLSSYFAGFTSAALRCGPIIERVGHIRAYAAFAGMVVAATATMPLLLGPLSCLVLRAVVGFGCARLHRRQRIGGVDAQLVEAHVVDRNPKAADAAARAQARTPFSRPRQKLYLGFPFLGKERQELRRVSERPFGQGAPPLILMLLLDRKQSSK